jgi:hypothetical protein
MTYLGECTRSVGFQVCSILTLMRVVESRKINVFKRERLENCEHAFKAERNRPQQLLWDLHQVELTKAAQRWV